MQIQKLIVKSAKGERRAQKQFFELYSDRLFAVAKRYAISDADAEEALFEAFLIIYAKLSTFNFINEAALFVWLRRIVVNQCLMGRRKEMNILYKVEQIDEEYHDLQLHEQADDQTLIDLVNHLPDGYKTVFLMYVVDGYSHQEIAQTLNISEGTSRSQFFKARKLLQKQLNDDERFGTNDKRSI